MRRSFDRTVESLETLVAKCYENPKLASMLAIEQQDLEELLIRMRDAKALQVALDAAKRRATLDWHQLGTAALDLASRIRWGIVSVLGRRTPEVAEFGIAPFRVPKDAPR
jgi:hypothetical protein